MAGFDPPAQQERQERYASPAGRLDRGLPRDRRLRRSGDFQTTFEGGRRFVGRYMVLWPREAEDAAGRLGVVASKRTFRRSVDRSRAKRLLREAFRLHRGDLREDRDVILVARWRILDVGCRDVEDDLMFLAGKTGLRRDRAAGTA